MSTEMVEKGVEDVHRIELEYLEQRDALKAEAERVTERMLAWHARREKIDVALSSLRHRLERRTSHPQ